MTTRMHARGTGRRTSLLAAAFMLGTAATAVAQETRATTDARWAPWVGCWQASGRDLESLGVSPGSQTPLPTVCIVPATGAAAIDLVTVNGTQIASTERIDATGSRRAVSREGCEGWETADFSPDAKRIYLRSEHQCTGNRTRTSTGIMSISPNGEWLDVQGVRVEANNAVRVAHYGKVPLPAALSADMKAALQSHALARNTAALAASDSIDVADVIEASRRADALVVQAWLVERGQGFNMNAKRLAQVSDAKVAPNVIDVMVALSYPRAFAINLAGANGQVVPTEQTRALAENDIQGDGPMVYMNWDPFYSSYDTYGYGYYNRYGYGRYGPLGYSPWYSPTNNVVVVRPAPSAEPDTRGRMVKGSGYTRPDDRRDPGSSSGGTRTSVGSSGSGGSTSTGSSGSGGGEQRTAKPRSP